MDSIFLASFQNIFLASSSLETSPVVLKLERRVTDEMNSRLGLSFTRAEVDVALL